MDKGTTFGFVAPMITIVLVSRLTKSVYSKEQTQVLHTDQCYFHVSGSTNSVQNEKRSTAEKGKKISSCFTGAREVN